MDVRGYAVMSGLQEWQMTSVIHDDVHNVAIDGNFDNCQVRSSAITLVNNVGADLVVPGPAHVSHGPCPW